jgi:hypothetical protein
MPRKASAIVNTHPQVVSFQSPGAGASRPMSVVTGRLNTLRL